MKIKPTNKATGNHREKVGQLDASATNSSGGSQAAGSGDAVSLSPDALDLPLRQAFVLNCWEYAKTIVHRFTLDWDQQSDWANQVAAHILEKLQNGRINLDTARNLDALRNRCVRNKLLDLRKAARIRENRYHQAPEVVERAVSRESISSEEAMIIAEKREMVQEGLSALPPASRKTL